MPIRVSNVTAQILSDPSEKNASASHTLGLIEEPFARGVAVSNATVQILQLEPNLSFAVEDTITFTQIGKHTPAGAQSGEIKGCVYMGGFFRCFHPRPATEPNTFIPFTQEVSLAGSDWARSVTSTLNLIQSEYLFETISDPISFVDIAVGDKDSNQALVDAITFSDGNTISGGRFITTVSDTAIFDSTTIKGMAVYVVSDGHVDLAQADALATAGVIGLAHLDVAASTVGTYITEGLVIKSDWTAVAGTANLTPGALYYLSTTIPGALTSTAPTLTGDILVSVGRAADNKTLDVSIRNPIVL